MGALTKMLTQVPRISRTVLTRAISTPSAMPTISDSDIPMPKVRKDISTALMNFSLGRTVVRGYDDLG